MKHLNTAFRGIHKATDVLSFPQLSAEGQEESSKVQKFTSAEAPDLRTSELILGDIVISVPAAEEQAEMSGRGFYDEIYRLLIHGTMHLLGYSHEKSRYTAAAMRKKERELLNAVKKMG